MVGGGAQAQRSPPLVLVVEDSEDAYELFSDALAYGGYAVSGAGDGPEAIACARRLLPDLIVLDLGLPGISGCDVALTLKADPLTRQIPILAVTGYVGTDAARRALAAGCEGVISKPCHLDVLLAEVALHVARPAPDTVVRGR